MEASGTARRSSARPDALRSFTPFLLPLPLATLLVGRQNVAPSFRQCTRSSPQIRAQFEGFRGVDACEAHHETPTPGRIIAVRDDFAHLGIGVDRYDAFDLGVGGKPTQRRTFEVQHHADAAVVVARETP